MRMKSKVFRFVMRDPAAMQKTINKWLSRHQEYSRITIEHALLSNDHSEVGMNLILLYRQEKK